MGVVDKIRPAAMPASLENLAGTVASGAAAARDAVAERAGEAKTAVAGRAGDAREAIEGTKARLVRRQKKAAKALRRREKKAAKALRRTRSDAQHALGAKQAHLQKDLSRRRKKAKRALGEQQAKVGRRAARARHQVASSAQSLTASIPSRDAVAELLTSALTHDAVANGAAVGIDRLLGDIRTGRFEQTMSALTAGGAAITAVEIFTSHDGASFGNKMMWWPVVIVPVAVPVGIASVFSKKVAKTALPFVSAVIVLNSMQGMYFHCRGIAQKPGGLRHNLRYNLEMGPPLFAPLLAGMVGGMGILAAILRREEQ